MENGVFLISAVLRSLISASVTKGYALCHRGAAFGVPGAPPPDPRPAGGYLGSFLSFVYSGKEVE